MNNFNVNKRTNMLFEKLISELFKVYNTVLKKMAISQSYRFMCTVVHDFIHKVNTFKLAHFK